MPDELVGTVTRLLHDYQADDPASGQLLFEAIYPELRRLAGRLMRRERPNHTMQATELVHDAFLRLVDQTVLRDADRPKFLGIAARARGIRTLEGTSLGENQRIHAWARRFGFEVRTEPNTGGQVVIQLDLASLPA